MRAIELERFMCTVQYFQRLMRTVSKFVGNTRNFIERISFRNSEDLDFDEVHTVTHVINIRLQEINGASMERI